MSLETGDVVWEHSTGQATSLLGVAGTTAYVENERKERIDALDVETGEVRHSYPVETALSQPMAVSDGGL
ncbi:hypothetical protein [Halegenticoccus soli]|uniref:hypothetical protein n=1 Tax=Halegenticoccus soli TaxID=1985678 RepID=UPI000C6CB41D|nr:hypothetical protein [Halegenticoccus soli]